jgi:organic radical activating enzyme
MSKLANSYTAANNFPMKILKNEELMRNIKNGKVVPWHVQLNITNRCNFHCDFCSCENRDKSLCMPYAELEEMMRLYKKLGMACVTITGGGEPTLHPDLSKLLKLLRYLDVEVGLVSNGSMLHRLTVSDLNRIKWLRVSCSDVLPKQFDIERWFKNVDAAVKKDSSVDWAFSYVVSANPDFKLLKRVIDYANLNGFTHVRLVSDLFNIESVPNMMRIRDGLADLGVDISRVIFQGRKTFTHGQSPCYISLLKPVVSAEGKLFACCGSQYSLKVPTKDYEQTMSMGSWRDLPKLIEQQKFFDGSKCYRCYYSEYQILGDVLKPLEHTRFV